MMKNKIDISIIIPVYNEEKSINPLFKEIIKALNNISNWELIFIDDGSSDSSKLVISDIVKKNKNIKLISFLKNKGKSEALNAGFKICKGKKVVTIDADLQDDPAEIYNIINKLDDGFDMVSGWKINRKDPFSKTLPSKLFNFILKCITGIKIHDFNCGLKGYRLEVVKTLNIYGGLHRFIPVLAKHNGFEISEIKVNHRERKYGKSKYGTSRLFHGFYDLITLMFFNKYLNRPLHFFGLIGIICLIFGISINLYLTFNWFNGLWITPFKNPIFFLGILLIIIGVQFFSIGLIGELIVRFHKKDDNNYYIDE